MSVLGLVIDGARGQSAPPAAGAAQAPPSDRNDGRVNRYEFKVWHADYPFPGELPSHRRAGKWYGRSRQRAIDKVIANLEGSCTRRAFLIAKEFFDRQQDVDEELLIEALDAALLQKSKGDHAHNLAEAMGRMKNPAFAEALKRAAQHTRSSVRRSAIRALVGSGSEKVLLQLQGAYSGMSRLERMDWIRAAYRHFPDKRLAPLTKALLLSKDYAAMADHALEQVAAMPAKRANALLTPLRGQLSGIAHMKAAGIAHQAGDAWGTGALRQALAGKDETIRLLAVLESRAGDVGSLVDDLLKLTTTSNEKVAIALIKTLARADDSRVDDTLRMFAAATSLPVRQSAYRALNERGKTEELEELLEVVRKGTGTKLRLAVADLVAAGYGPVAGALMQRYAQVEGREKLSILRSISQMRAAEGLEALITVFRDEPTSLPTKLPHDTVSFMGVLLGNMGQHGERLFKLLVELPKSDYRRRSAVMNALVGIAVFSDDQALRKRIYDAFRKIVMDGSEIPQVRIQALDNLRKDLRLSDAMAWKRHLSQEKSVPMRKLLCDFLFEFF